MKILSLILFFLVFLSLQTHAQPQWTFPLSVTDGQSMITLTIGIHPAGTDGFDAGLDAFAPPPPPSGSFDARLRVPSPPDDYITDIRSNSNGVKTWYAYYQAGSGHGPVVISWDSSALPAPMIITDNINGTFFSQDMSLASRVSSSNTFLATSLRIFTNITLSVEENQKPIAFQLEQNYPNPFNPSTTIKYQIPRPTDGGQATTSHVVLKIHNLLGQEVTTLIDEVQEAGYKSVVWNAGNVASGVYFYRIEATSSDNTGGSFRQIKRMLLLK